MSATAFDDIALSVFLNEGRFGLIVRCPPALSEAVSAKAGEYVGAGVCRVVIPAGVYPSGHRPLWTCTYEFERGCSPGSLVDELLSIAALAVGATS